MPGISDPGAWLTAEAIAAGVPVIPFPAPMRAQRAGRQRPAHRRISIHWISAGEGRRTAHAAGSSCGRRRRLGRTLIFTRLRIESSTRWAILSRLGSDLRVVGARADQDARGVSARTVAEARRD